MPHITIVDKPCGYGKSTEINRNFKKSEKYIAVVPYLSEVERFIKGARTGSDFILTQPICNGGNKRDHCEKLIRAGKSIACTHQLFYRLGTLATQDTGVARCTEFDSHSKPTIEVDHLLSGYNLIIDEVVNPFEVEQTVRKVDFDAVYLGLGMAEEEPDGRIVPTEKWDELYRLGDKTLNRSLYEKAKSGALYRISEKLLVLAIPKELLLKPKSVTIYTYLSEGSVLLQYLQKLRKDHPECFTLEVERLDAVDEAAWREDVANALTVLPMPEIANQKWTHCAQLKSIKTHRECSSIGQKLRKFKDRELYGVNLKTVMLTCARDLWHGAATGQKPKAGRLSKHTRLFGRAMKEDVYNKDTETFDEEWTTNGVSFVPNTTRGTNDHIGCTTAVYLYDQHPNPQLLTFLRMKRDSKEAHRFSDAYALTELVQWLFRSAIRVGGLNGTGHTHTPRRRVTLYMPSKRMRNLLLNWLLTGQVNSGPVNTTGQRQTELLARLEGRQVAAVA
ncbi:MULTISPECIES: hypothetical protein [unclassified Ruegeria]|uniref:hypothetical protein n=1 Tax=unclassified Ruegeria TaxID=2625375 RepID=UPI00148A03B0|nr:MULTISPECIES: hypothetical protein [unclassified Ruegeria]